MNRVSRTVLAVTVLVVAAGCTGGHVWNGPGDQATVTTTAGSGTTAVTTVARATYPAPPDTLTSESAKAVAVEYEAARLQNLLRNGTDVTYFDLGFMRPANATVLNETDDGLYVRVDATYSYGTPNKSADGVPVVSLYHVNETTVRHVNETT